MGLEGIVAKKADAPYKSGRSDLWQKIRADKTGDFVVVGYTAPKGSRGGFGALPLGGYADGKLVYAGRAGSGFTGQMLKDVGDQPVALETPRPPFEGLVPAEKESHWVKPELVAEVRYKRSEEHTSELQSQSNLVCRLLLEKKKTATQSQTVTAMRHKMPPAHSTLPYLLIISSTSCSHASTYLPHELHVRTPH